MAENPFDEETNEQETPEPRKGPDQSKAFERITAERDEARQARAAAEERALAAERRIAFDDLGIDRKYAELYTGEVDPEKVKGWATQYGFLKAEESPAAPETGASEAPPEPSAPAKAGSPPVVGGSPKFEGKISAREYQNLIVSGDAAKIAEAQKAWNEGRVDLLTGGRFTGGQPGE